MGLTFCNQQIVPLVTLLFQAWTLGTRSSLQWLPLSFEKYILTSGNWQFLAMLTSGSQVGNRKFQGLGTGSSWSWQPLVPTMGTIISSNLWELEVPCNGNQWFPGWETLVPAAGNRQLLAMVTYGSQVGNGKFQAWEPAVPCLGAIFFVSRLRTNRQFQPWGTGSSCKGNLWFPGLEAWVPSPGNRQLLASVTHMIPRLGTNSSNLSDQAAPCNGNLWFPGWEP